MEIKGFENYLIYEDGRVWSKPKGGGGNRFLKPCGNGRGYLQVILCKNGLKYGFTIHRLVGEHYIENPDNKAELDHIDRNKHNNHVSNIRWATHSENGRNRCISGAIPFRGVSKSGKKFRASIKINNIVKHLGMHLTPEEASNAYNTYCIDNGIALH